MPVTSREVHLVARPNGMPREEEFAIVERTVPDAADGQIQVKNLYLSIDPAMRPRLSAAQPLNEAMAGGAIGRVVQSRHPSFKEGDLVQHRWSFREFFVSDGQGVARLDADPALPVTVYMHVLGGSGFVAYGGLLEIGKLKAGEQVFVSTAAGAVGSAAVQIAKLKGAYVIGSTGSEDKCRWLKDDLGVDAVINYKQEPIREALKKTAVNGIDVYFDNVGGDHLNAALPRMNTLGRIPVCGMISAYNTSGSISAPVTTLSTIIYSRVTIRGFVGTDFPHLREPFVAEMNCLSVILREQVCCAGFDGFFNKWDRSQVSAQPPDTHEPVDLPERVRPAETRTRPAPRRPRTCTGRISAAVFRPVRRGQRSRGRASLVLHTEARSGRASQPTAATMV